MADEAALLAAIDESLVFTWHAGDTTSIERPHTTGWRVLPYLVTACCDAAGTLEIAGEPTVIGRGGCAIIVPAGVHHRCSLSARRGVSRWSCVTYTVLGGVDLCALLDLPWQVHGAAAERIGTINHQLAELARQPPSLRGLVRRRELGLALLAVVVESSSWRPEPDRAARASERMRPVFARMQRELARPLRVEALARGSGLSPARFHAIFRDASGTSPHAYLQQLRLRTAQELLLASDLPIQDIAARVGYADPFLFSRAFRKRFGKSPSQYRAATAARLM